MGHTIELVVMWLGWALVVGVVAAVAGLVARALGRRDWPTIRIVEGAFAIGIVMGFVVMLFMEMLSL